MKTTKIITIATAITIAIIALCGIATASAEVYPLTAKVIEVDYIADLVTVETFMGHLYMFEGCEDWQEGDCCALIMEDNGTELVIDDKIVMAQYSAWTLINWQMGE